MYWTVNIYKTDKIDKKYPLEIYYRCYITKTRAMWEIKRFMRKNGISKEDSNCVIDYADYKINFYYSNSKRTPREEKEQELW